MNGRSRRPHRSRLGEVAVFDIVLFVPLLLVALFFLNTLLSIPTSIASENVNGTRYGQEALSTTLGSTFPGAMTYVWIPPSFFCGSPNGCWVQGYTPNDASVASQIQSYVMEVSCQVGGPGTQRQLDQPGWIGYVINQTAQTVGEGTQVGGIPTTFSSYYLQFNGSAFRDTFGCNVVPQPAYAFFGYDPVTYATEVYTWSTIIPADDFANVGNVQVVMGEWQP